MPVPNLTSKQQGIASQIYSYFYNYALGQGADTAGAQEFGNLGVGVAQTEGLGGGGASGWGTNPDRNVTALGPFQFNLNNGLGTTLGFNSSTSPAQQLQGAANYMWNGSGTYDTGPWNGVGNSVGLGPAGNNTLAGQNQAINIGAGIAQKYGFSGDGSAPSITSANAASYGVTDQQLMDYYGTSNPSDAWNDFNADQASGGAPSQADLTGTPGNSPGFWGKGQTSRRKRHKDKTRAKDSRLT
jgi:hypothetical protein